jgi:uncharacterized membrane protein
MTSTPVVSRNFALASAWSRRWRAVAAAAMVAQILVVVSWTLLPTPTLQGSVIALILCVPLLAPLIGVLRAHRYTYKWATLCVAPYFVVGLTEAVANPSARWLAGALLAGALTWFAALLGFLRTSRDPER